MVTKLTKVNIKDIWKTEDKDFTPWLVENINLLNEDIVLLIVDNFIIEVEAQLDEKGVTLFIDQSAKELLAKKGYDEVYGARELSRVIQEEIKKPIAEELIFGKISKGGHVSITLKDNKIEFSFSKKEMQNKVLV